MALCYMIYQLAAIIFSCNGRVRVVLGTSCLGYELSWVRVVLGTSRLGYGLFGYELSWVRVVLGTSCPGYELSWVRVVHNPAPRYWPLWGEFTGHRWIPHTKASNAEYISIWWRHHYGSGFLVHSSGDGKPWLLYLNDSREYMIVRKQTIDSCISKNDIIYCFTMSICGPLYPCFKLKNDVINT